jgi:anti-sigma factor RsiW
MTVPHETDLDHPTESELSELALGELDEARSSAISGHLRACPQCRILADRLGRGLPGLPAVDPPGDTYGAVPEVALAAVAAADRPKAGPRPGELWRAGRHGGGPVTVVWVRALDPTGAAVVPVSLDTELADEHTLIVPAAASPLGISLAMHVPVETTIDERHLLDRLGAIDVAAEVASLRDAWLTGAPVQGLHVGPSIVSPLDERVEYRAALADRLAEFAPVGEEAQDRSGNDQTLQGGEPDDWWRLAAGSVRAELLMALHHALGGAHAAARVVPRPPAAAASEHLGAVALVGELDAFVLVAAVEGGGPLQGPTPLESARLALQADQLLNAVCLVEPVAPFMAVVVDRRDVVEAIETPSGELRPPRQGRPPSPVGDALVKFLDTTITPFGRLAGTVVEGEAVDPRGLAADVSADAVRTVSGSARGFKVEGKRPGYERVTRHKAAIGRLVEAALGDPDIDIASIMELDE